MADSEERASGAWQRIRNRSPMHPLPRAARPPALPDCLPFPLSLRALPWPGKLAAWRASDALQMVKEPTPRGNSETRQLLQSGPDHHSEKFPFPAASAAIDIAGRFQTDPSAIGLHYAPLYRRVHRQAVPHALGARQGRSPRRAPGYRDQPCNRTPHLGWLPRRMAAPRILPWSHSRGSHLTAHPRTRAPTRPPAPSAPVAGPRSVSLPPGAAARYVASILWMRKCPTMRFMLSTPLIPCNDREQCRDDYHPGDVFRALLICDSDPAASIVARS